MSIKMDNITRAFHKVGFTLKKHSPEILVVAGTVGVVASTVMACKATTKLSTVLEKSKNDVETIHAYVEDNGFSEEYTEEDSKKDLAIVYTKTGVELAKLYAPSVVLGVASLAAILTSHKILRGRNIALAAAYATVDKGFKEYRERLIERFGGELDKELKYNIKAKEIEEVVTDENGEERVVKTIVDTATIEDYSAYARVFDETCLGWTKDAEYNMMFLKQVQNNANLILKREGFIYLNDVYKMLGFSPTKAGQVVGWMYDPNGELGDNYIDFGIFNIHSEAKRLFINGLERSIILDFNVDGNIWEMMN